MMNSNRKSLLLTCLLLAAAGGCHRSFYREQADMEAYGLISEKAAHPHWNVHDFGLNPDIASRHADVDHADGPPMPIDDPVSHAFMHQVDGRPGYPFWDVNGHTQFVENPHWRSFLPLDENGVLRLDAAKAVQLARTHSPDYQTQLETLYLSALDVSAERFAFDPQYAAGYGVSYDAFGRLHPSGGGESASVFDASTTEVQLRRFFTTGAELVVGFANSLIWQFSGADAHSTSTLINFSLVQPLLQGAGRDKILEGLTLAERNLLAAVRQLERYRRGFYLDITMGNGEQGGPRRTGGALGQDFGVNPRNAGGLLGLLQTQLSIRNQEANLNALRSSLSQLEALSRKGAVDFFQVDQTRERVTRGTTQLLSSKQAYRDRLDAFKRSLGLPPTLDVEIDDDSLDIVNLTDPEIQEVQDRVKLLRRRVSQSNIALLELMRSEEGIMWNETLQGHLGDIQQQLTELDVICDEVLNRTIQDVREEIESLRAAIPRRKQFALEMQARIRLAKESGQATLAAEVDESIFDVDRVYGLRKIYADDTQREVSLDELPDYLEEWLDKTVASLEEIKDKNKTIRDATQQLENAGANLQPEDLATTVDEEILKPNPDQYNLAEAGVIELLLIGALARAESLMLPEVDISADEALAIARIFRRDWMNARASLVDSWRQIEFIADDLESVLDIVFTGEIRNRGDNPLRLRDDAGALGVGVQFDGPLNRLLERNAYREVLVRYQQARRDYYQVEDQISQSLRSIARQVEFNKVNFEVQRTLLRVAVAQVRTARSEIEKPPRPMETRSLSPVASRNLIDALSGLNSAQDDFIDVWVNYQVQRGLLDLQMGTMRLDDLGLWIDPGAIGPKHGYPSSDRLLEVPEYASGCLEMDSILHPFADPPSTEEVPTPEGAVPLPALEPIEAAGPN